MLFFWMIIIIFALLAYVVLDGYDLGIGVLALFQPDAARRRQMLEVVGNVWDGNESWLSWWRWACGAACPTSTRPRCPASTCRCW
jgi:cytochrome bd-type quinol oxidase subunit 2